MNHPNPVVFGSKEHNHYKLFQEKYRAKALPSLILVDAEGEEIQKLQGNLTVVKNVLKQLQTKR